MTDLPPGWEWAKIGDVGHVQLGRQRSPKFHTGDNMRPYLRVANVFEDRIDTSSVMSMHFEPEEFERYRLHPGDILLNEGQSPEFLGRPAMYRGIPEDVAFTNSLIRFRAYEGIDPKWALLVFRRHMRLGRFRKEARITTNIAHLSAARFKDVEFPVPPLGEQRQAVESVALLESRIASGVCLSGSASLRIDRLSSRLLEDAVNIGNFDAISTTLGAVSRSIRNGIFISRAGTLPDGVPILRIGSVRAMRLDLNDVRYSGRTYGDLDQSKYLLRAGDLLFTRYNGNPRFVGACAVVPDRTGPLTFPDKLIRVDIDQTKVLPQYVAMACSAREARRYIQACVKTTAGQAGISGKELRGIPLILPPLEHQARAVQEFSDRMDLVNRQRTMILSIGGHADRLIDAILENAVTGRAVDQDREGKLASMTSEWFRGERATAEAHPARYSRVPARKALPEMEGTG